MLITMLLSLTNLNVEKNQKDQNGKLNWQVNLQNVKMIVILVILWLSWTGWTALYQLNKVISPQRLTNLRCSQLSKFAGQGSPRRQ